MFEANKKIVNHLRKKNLQNNKQYGFRISRYIADVLTVTVRRINEALHNKSITRAIAYVISRRVLSFINPSYRVSP